RERHLPRRRHRFPPARRGRARQRGIPSARRRLPQRHLPQPRAHRDRGSPEQRRRVADREVQARVLLRHRRRGLIGRMATRPYLSIGEVLTLLKDEFPDVTISKIRFLESQGLLDPERTPSGYRKFYDNDVARLRWILRQQREHFLPLKVIKGRLIGEPETEPGGDD